MGKVKYGNTTIHYVISIEKELKHDYIQVEQGQPILYRSPNVTEEKADKYVLKKARWIIEKMKLVAEPIHEEIKTGSRLPYFGRKYYTEVQKGDKNEVLFSGSKFHITLTEVTQENINEQLQSFYRQKCIEKIKPRFNRWIKTTGYTPSKVSFRKMEKRWGSCTSEDQIILNIDASKLPWQLIDYLILHELCHIPFKDHTKDFWNEIRKHMEDYEGFDKRLDYWEV
ncbi:M48 family metallopeptidase [Flammeovirga sp. OC4]|uniref:M48 family metallopeptidase n=1 Tax=Flammeovirga sp. OC4 TaxID=1382345 RepID=UPI0005C5D293|nr:SprT family zinc-dependent metalloprotease [Flammeovirga sp. OC4]